jgi:O-antigen ligase
MSAWLSPLSLAALAVTALFAGWALRRPSAAVLGYVVLGAAPALQLGAVRGRTISQGLMLAEVLATVLFAAWLLRRGPSRATAPPLDLPLAIFAAICGASMVGVLVMPDPAAREASTAVSFGQLLLVFWPLAVYLAARDFITTTDQLRWIRRVLIVLSIPQLFLPFAPASLTPYLGWVATFALFGAPMAMATVFSTTSVPLRVLCVVLALAPAVRGVVDGKVFLYGYVIAAGITVVWMRASRLAAMIIAVVVGVGLVALAMFGEAAIEAPLAILLNKERSQMSFGGRFGRGELARTAISIWFDAPLLGVGPANSYIYMLQHRTIGTPHNQYLNLLVEFGLLGLMAFLVFLAMAARTGLRVYRNARDREHRTFALGWLGVFAGLAAGGLTGDYIMHSIRNGGLELFSGYYLQWVLLGAMVAIPGIEQRRGDAAAPARPKPRFWRLTARPAPRAARLRTT